MPRRRHDPTREAELGKRASQSETVENTPWMGRSKIARDARRAQGQRTGRISGRGIPGLFGRRQ